MRVIALEEHFATPAFLDGPERRFKERAEQMGGRFAALVTNLLDIGDGRVAAMDAAGVDVQAAVADRARRRAACRRGGEDICAKHE